MTTVPIGTIAGAAIPLLRPNVDTDVIIRVDRMVSTNPADLAPYAFEALRYHVDGTIDPSCPLNDPRFRGAPILIAGANFGCGSSREPAVWAIAGLGIGCIVAPSFGDIFRANCFQNGVLPIILDEGDVAALAANATDGARVVIDLPAQTITSLDDTWQFAIGQLQKTALVEGLDDLDLSIRYRDAIRNWESRDTVSRPWVWTASVNDGGAP
jgi:3-isopropylmalate/(R)-2-methylmalate dehydratase small subunit